MENMLFVNLVNNSDDGTCDAICISTPSFNFFTRYESRLNGFNKIDIYKAINNYINDLNKKYDYSLNTSDFNIMIYDKLRRYY